MQAGYVMITFAASTAVLCGFLGLALDLGYLEYRKRRMQSAADSAALSAAQEYRRGGTLANGRLMAAARQDAGVNGFTDGQDGVVVTLNSPPATGPYAGNQRFLTVNVSQDQPTYFMRFFNFNAATVQARAGAGMVSSPICVYVLEKTNADALTVTGAATADLKCGVAVDSTSPTAVRTKGSPDGCLKAAFIDITGGYSEGSCPISPAPQTGVPPSGDPLAYLQPPSATGPCDYGTDTTPFKLTAGIATINPGVYCGGITVGGAAILTLNGSSTTPYILRDGGFQTTGGSVVKGSGVTIYNTCSTPGACGASTSYGPIDFGGTSTIQLSAPTTGDWEGILFFQDRSAPPNIANRVIGTADLSFFNGILYFPTEPLEFRGDALGLLSQYTGIVARTLDVSGNSTLRSDYSSLIPAASPLKKPTLTE